MKTAVTKMQMLVGVDADGVLGKVTLGAINAKDPKTLFNELHDVRAAYYRAIVAKRPTNQKFLKGWLRRLDSYTFEA